MHFSIPDTQEFNTPSSSYTGFNIHINGVFHCCARYSYLLKLCEQIRKEFPSISNKLPRFPKKKLIPLSVTQLEERRLLLEKYIQAVGQDGTLSGCKLFLDFLLSAQLQTNGVTPDIVIMDVFLTNGFRVALTISTDKRSDDVLREVADKLGLPEDMCSYFCLFLEKLEEDNQYTLVRRLLYFESPYISLNSLPSTHRIVIRKSYWDSNLDLAVMEHKVGLNLLYLQTLSDIEKRWVICSEHHMHSLATLQSQGNKKQYMELARTLKFYGYVQFNPCSCDYPFPGSKVLVAAGNKELNLRVRLSHDDDVRQGCFKVTRMRCWRITTLHGYGNGAGSNMELSFEYLMARNKLQWVTISSEQAVLMSMCLQTMVEQLLDDTQARNSQSTDTSSSPDTTPSTSGTTDQNSMPSRSDVTRRSDSSDIIKRFDNSGVIKRSDSKHTVTFNQAKSIVRNQCFDNDGIGDDDL